MREETEFLRLDRSIQGSAKDPVSSGFCIGQQQLELPILNAMAQRWKEAKLFSAPFASLR
jgi:hypothetical protein